MRLETTSSDALFYGYDKRFPDAADAAQSPVLPSDKLDLESAMMQHAETGSFDLHLDNDYDEDDDDVFMDSHTVSSHMSIMSESASDEVNSHTPDSEQKPVIGNATSGDDLRPDASMQSDSCPRRNGRLLRRRLFSKSRQHLCHESGQTDESETSSELSHRGETAFVAKEKLVNLSHEKLRSYSTDFHSNSDGLRNRVLVESTLKKFFLQEIGSPPRSALPSTPRKRSVSSSPLSSESSPAFAYDDDTTRTLSDSIKRMKIIHSTPSSRTSVQQKPLEDECGQETGDAEVSIELDDYAMTDMTAVFRKIHCLTDLPIDAEF